MKKTRSTIRFLEERTDASWRGFLAGRPLKSALFGAFTFEERWEAFGDSLDTGDIPPGLVLVVSSRAIPSPRFAGVLRRAGAKERAWVDRSGAFAAALVEEKKIGGRGDCPEGGAILTDIGGEECDAIAVVGAPWNIVSDNGERIIADLRDGGAPEGKRRLFAGEAPKGTVFFEGDFPVTAKEGIRLEPFVFFDTREGPIDLGARVTVESNTILRGPLVIRHDAVIRGGAKVGEGTTIGEGSRVGGEVECTVFGAFSNKQHDGFLGHAVVGEWVNLGAATNNSDLKNNYGAVRVDFGEGPVDTGERKIGCFLGDHVKSAIGTRIGTGATAGPCANLFGRSGLVTGFIPPFTWGEEGGLYDFDKAVETMEEMRRRRGALLARGGRPAALPERRREALRALWERERAKREGGH